MIYGRQAMPMGMPAHARKHPTLQLFHTAASPGLAGADRRATQDQKPPDTYLRYQRSAAIRAVIASLQDLGFIIERANESLGLLTAARFAEPNYYDVISVTVPQDTKDRLTIRANAIYNKPIDDPKVYQNFFAFLERSLFLTKE